MLKDLVVPGDPFLGQAGQNAAESHARQGSSDSGLGGYNRYSETLTIRLNVPESCERIYPNAIMFRLYVYVYTTITSAVRVHCRC